MSTKKIKSTVIKSGTVLKIDVSAEYYYRTYDLMVRLLERQPDPKQALINVDTPGTELTLSEAVIQTFMMLVKSCEEVANKNTKKYTEEIEVEVNANADLS